MKRTLSVIAMGALLPLLASDGGLKFGVKVGASAPVSKVMKEDLKKVGGQFGLFTTYDLGSGHGVGASVDFNAYAVKRDSSDKHHGIKVGVNTVSLGANYTYHLNQKNDGAYLLAGVDVQKLSLKVDVAPFSLKAKPDHNKAFGYTVGVGYDFNEKMGAQVSYNAHNYKKISPGNDLKLGVVNVGFTYKF